MGTFSMLFCSSGKRVWGRGGGGSKNSAACGLGGGERLVGRNPAALGGGADHCNEAGWQKFCCRGGGGGGDSKNSAAGGWGGGGGARGWLAEILLHGGGLGGG